MNKPHAPAASAASDEAPLFCSAVASAAATAARASASARRSSSTRHPFASALASAAAQRLRQLSHLAFRTTAELLHLTRVRVRFVGSALALAQPFRCLRRFALEHANVLLQLVVRRLGRVVRHV